MHRQPVGQLHSHPTGPLEAKAVVPALSMLTLVAVVEALYAVADEFGLDLTQGQELTLARLGVALLPVLHFVIAYFTRHTPRPDLNETPST